MGLRSWGWGGLVVAGPLVVGLGAPGHAEARVRLGDVSCTGTYRMEVSPPIRSVVLEGEKATTFTGAIDLEACESVAHPKITSGRMTLKATGKAACDVTHANVHVRDGSGRGAITWNTGERSAFTAATWKGDLSALTLGRGGITDGLMKGGRVDLTAVPENGVVATSYGCSTVGVDRLDGSIRTADFAGA
ncbi:hypothetical protein GCM10022221_47710 [Actinocorallia aurea]